MGFLIKQKLDSSNHLTNITDNLLGMKIKSYRTLVLGTPWRNLTYLILELEDGTMTRVGNDEANGGGIPGLLDYLVDSTHQPGFIWNPAKLAEMGEDQK